MVVVIVILGLGFLNVIPGFHLGGSGGGGGGKGAPSYAVNFTETGLPASTSWSVTLNGATESGTTSMISFQEVNGTYAYSIGCVPGYTATPPTGSVMVTGAAFAVGVSFSAGGTCISHYSVTFTESGLSSGTIWQVTLQGTPSSASAPNSIVFPQANGTYSYTIGAIAGYTAQPSSGTVTVSGQPYSQAIVFTTAATGNPVSSSQAMTIGGATVNNYQSHAWYLVFAYGFTQPTTSTESMAGFAGGCAYSGPATVVVPGFSGSLTSGLSPFWFLVYNQTGSASVHAIVSVTNGAGAVVGTVTGANCELTNYTSLGGMTLVSSTAAISAADSGGNVTAFINSHGMLYSEMGLLAKTFGATTTAFWGLVWSTCNPTASAPLPGITLTWVVDAQTGSVLVPGTVGSC